MFNKTRSTRVLGTVLSIGLFLFLIVSLSSILPANAETLGTWTQSSNNYPGNTTGESCATYQGYIYCVGGYLVPAPLSGVKYASVSSSGVGTWSATTSYPTGFWDGSCAIDSGYIYCVGGDIDQNGDFTTNVYYAPVSSSGVGAWTLATNPIPFAIADESCAASGGDIYCVGGTADTSYPNTPSNAVFYASVSSSGVGTWHTSDYPELISAASCSISSSYIYCVGGLTLPTLQTIPVPSPGVYYASVSSSGVGGWTEEANYPITVARSSCTAYNGYDYCVGGQTNNDGVFTADVYYASVSSAGVGTWTSTTSYPEAIYSESCASYSDNLFCVGGQITGSFITGAVYYNAVSGSSTSTSTSSSSTTSTSTTTSSSTASTSSTLSLTAHVPAVPVCPSTFGGILMPVGTTFTDLSGHTWVAPGGNLAGGVLSSYFFPGPQSSTPPPMQAGWGGVYGDYDGQQGWIVTFYCV